jgi:hypothetical protein
MAKIEHADIDVEITVFSDTCRHRPSTVWPPLQGITAKGIRRVARRRDEVTRLAFATVISSLTSRARPPAAAASPRPYPYWVPFTWINPGPFARRAWRTTRVRNHYDDKEHLNDHRRHGDGKFCQRHRMKPLCFLDFDLITGCSQLVKLLSLTVGNGTERLPNLLRHDGWLLMSKDDLFAAVIWLCPSVQAEGFQYPDASANGPVTVIREELH